MYVQGNAIKARGIFGYIKDYFAPFFLLFPLNIIGTLATIVSISFRLFGNIFSGAIIGKLYLNALAGNFLFEMLGILSGINIILTLFFVLFAGTIQAFVFSMLTLTYLAMAITQEPTEERS